jgi:hypothetical protein
VLTNSKTSVESFITQLGSILLNVQLFFFLNEFPSVSFSLLLHLVEATDSFFDLFKYVRHFSKANWKIKTLAKFFSSFHSNWTVFDAEKKTFFLFRSSKKFSDSSIFVKIRVEMKNSSLILSLKHVTSIFEAQN